jgi:hypothetical protein
VDDLARNAVVVRPGRAAAVRGSRIILAWKGISGDSSIWFSFLENGEFGGQIRVPNVGTSVGPSLVDVGGQTLMAWQGVSGDSNIYWSQLP